MAHSRDGAAICVAQMVPGPHCTLQSPYFNFIIRNGVRAFKCPKVKADTLSSMKKSSFP